MRKEPEMKDVKILGTGCPKCEALTRKVEALIREHDLELNIENIKEISEIMKYGVMMTPALVVDGQVKTVGTVPSDKMLLKLLSE